VKTPREVANLVIKAIRDNDIDLMVSLFNSANRRKFLPLTGEKRKIMSMKPYRDVENARRRLDKASSQPNFWRSSPGT